MGEPLEITDELLDFLRGPMTFKGPMYMHVPDTPDGHKILDYIGISIDDIEDSDD